MKTSHRFLLGIVLFLFTAHSAFSQKDYIIKSNNDSIGGITILGFPVKMALSVNAYNTNLMIKYEDYRIKYTTATGKTDDEVYSNIKAFSVHDSIIIPWHARKLSYTDGRIEFTKIVEVKGKTKDQLYASVRSFMIGSLGLTADAIQKFMIEDKDNGVISFNNIVDGAIVISHYNEPTFSNWMMYDFTVMVKDNKCKITATNFRYHYETGRIFNNKFVEKKDIKVEEFVNIWKSNNGSIKSHWYQGLMMMTYCAEDKLINGISTKLLAKEVDW